MMEITMKLLNSIIAAGLITLASTTAHAEISSGCDAGLSMMTNYTNSVEISGKRAERDRSGLLGKIDDARVKMELAKDADAWQKLEDYKMSVAKMAGAAKAKLSLEDAGMLTDAAIDTQIICTGM